MVWLDERVAKTSVSHRWFMICCQSGHVMLPTLPPSSTARHIIDQANFLDNIRMYNSILSFTSMGGSIDHSVMDGSVPYSVRISGNNYHWIGSWLSVQGQKPKFAQLYVYDTHNEVQNWCRALTKQESVRTVDHATLQALHYMLDAINLYVRVFRNTRDILQADNVVDLRIRIIRHQGTPWTAIYHANSKRSCCSYSRGWTWTRRGTRHHIVRKIDGNLQWIYETHPSYMPL